MLSEYQKFKVVRPILGEHKIDEYSMPMLHKTTEEMFDLENAVGLNLTNLSCKYNNKNKIIFPFNYDEILIKYWMDPFKYIPAITTASAIGTPDFSVYKGMNVNEIQHNVFMNRWCGCLWQDYGAIVIPTIQWATNETYDICFAGVEKGNVVMISTLGCFEHANEFLLGFNAMKRKIQPSLIIVYGEMIDGMYGRFVNYEYDQCFNKNKINFKQEELFHISKIFERKVGDNNG